MAQHYFAARLRELREARGWSQQELAERAGLHMMTVSRFERDTLKPTWEIALTLADALGVDCRAFCQEPEAPAQRRGPGRPPKVLPAAHAPPPAGALQGQAKGPARKGRGKK